MPTELEDYLFDLRGYLVFEKAVSTDHVRQLNTDLDPYVSMKLGEWRQNVHRLKEHEIHNIIEISESFEQLIDLPSWLDHINRYVGSDGLFIDEAFVNVRGKGGEMRLHSGAHKRRVRTQFRFHNNEFRCGQIVFLLALTDISLGDGGTMVIPGSHKSNLPLPRDWIAKGNPAGGLVKGVPARAGDAIVFTETLVHGTLPWTVDAPRQTAFYKFSPHGTSWTADYFEPTDFSQYPDMTDRKMALLEPPNARYAGRRTRPPRVGS